jgi:hypothetical protein
MLSGRFSGIKGMDSGIAVDATTPTGPDTDEAVLASSELSCHLFHTFSSFDSPSGQWSCSEVRDINTSDSVP